MPPASERHGWCWTTRLQRYGRVSRIGLCARGGSSFFSGAHANPAMSVMMASGKPTSSGEIFRPAPNRAMARKPAAMMPRHRVTSTRCWAKPSSAGSRVIDATIVTATVVAAPMPRPDTNCNPMSSMPSSDTTTVRPANTTARPAVSIALTVASWNDCPARRFSRYRVTMNRA